MASVSGVSAISQVFSKLGDNTGSVIPMFAKDTASNGLISYTYFKESGKVEGVEKTLEEFGTGLIWLGGIPFVKKFIFDKHVYKKMNLNPDIDAKRLFNPKESSDSIDFALKMAKGSDKYKEQAEILSKTMEKCGAAKKLSVAKFGLSTLATGIMMWGLITLKQKNTEKEVEKEIKQQFVESEALKGSLSDNEVYKTFSKKDNNPSFTGIGKAATFFMTNPVANTAIIDGVITGTRLSRARKGEKFEVGFKEACQLAFIYGLATPLQKSLEFVSKKLFKTPIALDYPVLASEVLKNAVEAEKTSPNSSKLLNQAEEILKLAGNEKKISNENKKKVLDFVFNGASEEMGEVLKTSGIVGTYKTKEGVEQLSMLSSVNVKKIKNAAQNTIDTIKNATKSQDAAKYLKNSKLLKGAAIIANIGISAFLMGYVQPKMNMHIRKKNNGGDNTNPAIKNLQKEMKQKMTFEGKI